jgi:hypothetical protein
MGLLLVIGGSVKADPAPTKAIVVRAVEARSGPSNSDLYYPTSKLAPGQEVEIKDEKQLPWLAGILTDPGWLAIAPPPDSFSWIDKAHLMEKGIVKENNVPVRTGSSVYTGKPTTKLVKVSQGLLVVPIGKEEIDRDDNSVWVPIKPVPGEVRFIPADAVRIATPVQSVNASTPTQPTGVDFGRQSAIQEPLWNQAEKAEKEGNLAEAENLYRQLAAQTKDNDLRISCYNRIYFLRERARTAAPPAAPVYPYGQPVTTTPGRATSQYTYTPEGKYAPARQTANANYWQNPANDSGAKWRGPGRLMKSALPVDGKPAYILDMGTNQSIIYVVPQPGVNLDIYLNRIVYLSGPTGYHSGYRQEYMQAVQVQPQQ